MGGGGKRGSKGSDVWNKETQERQKWNRGCCEEGVKGKREGKGCGEMESE